MKRYICDIIVATNLSHVKRKDGTHAVRIRVQQRSNLRYFSQKIYLLPEQYKKIISSGPERETIERYQQMTSAMDRFSSIIKKLVDEEKFSFPSLELALRNPSSTTLKAAVEVKIDELKADEKYKTAEVYSALKSSLEKYFNGKDIGINLITRKLIVDFMRYLENHGNSATTISIKMRALHCIFACALNSGTITSNPMEGVKVPKWKRRQLDITPVDMQKLLNATRDDFKSENDWLALVVWRTIYYGNGLNMKDLLHLRKSNITITGEIRFQRHKTGVDVVIPISPKLAECFSILPRGKIYLVQGLDEYKNGSEAEEKRIRQITRNINDHLKNVCEQLKIKQKITTYWARHQFATVMMRNGVDIAYISQALGHTNIRTTQHYLEGYTPEQRAKYAELLTMIDNK